MLRIGPSGNSQSFYDEGHAHTYEEAKWLREKDLMLSNIRSVEA